MKKNPSLDNQESKQTNRQEQASSSPQGLAGRSPRSLRHRSDTVDGITARGSFLGNLRVPQRIGLLTLVLLIPTAISLISLITSQISEVVANNRAAEGFQVTQSLHQLEQFMGDNNLAQLQLGTNPDISVDMLEASNKVIADQAEKVIELAKSRNMKGTAVDVRSMVDEWLRINQSVIEVGAMTPDLIGPVNSILNGKLSKIYQEISVESELGKSLTRTNLLQPALELSRFNHETAPNNRHVADQISDTIISAYSSYKNPDGTLRSEDVVLFEMQYARQVDAYQNMVNQLEIAIAEQKDSSELKKALQTLNEVGDTAFKFAEDNVISKRRLTVPLEEFMKMVPALSEKYTEIFRIALNEQENYHKARSNIFVTRTILIVGLAVVFVLGILLLSSYIARSLIQPIRELTLGSKRIAQGDYAARIPVRSKDELGLLARTINETSAQLADSERIQADRLREAAILQENISSFLDITMDIAEGDLTKRGRVTEDVLGNVVDSINLMTAELGGVLKEAQQASRSVLHSSRSLLVTTDQVEKTTSTTAEGTQQIAIQLQDLIDHIRHMSDQANTSADTARQALLVSQHGQAAVSSTLNGMQNIRREVQSIAKRIKGLGDRSLEIQEIVDTISKIAQQTDLLALNASIEAEGAGEAGGRFSIVADEVRKLADTSSQATTRIATLIKTVQSEVQDVIESVEEGTREVEIGYQVAGTAGERLREIGQLTEQSAKLAENIAKSTQKQVEDVETVGKTVKEIADLAKNSQSSVEEGKNSAAQLENLAKNLGQNLTKFRLPT